MLLLTVLQAQWLFFYLGPLWGKGRGCQKEVRWGDGCQWRELVQPTIQYTTWQQLYKGGNFRKVPWPISISSKPRENEKSNSSVIAKWSLQWLLVPIWKRTNYLFVSNLPKYVLLFSIKGKKYTFCVSNSFPNPLCVELRVGFWNEQSHKDPVSASAM